MFLNSFYRNNSHPDNPGCYQYIKNDEKSIELNKGLNMMDMKEGESAELQCEGENK